MPDIKAIAAKQNPELLSLENKAKYKVLPDTLEVIEIISLIANNKDKEGKKIVTRLIRDAVTSGELLTETSGNTEFANNANSWGARGGFRLPVDYATVHKNAFKKYIDANNWNLENCFLNNWFDESENKTDIKQSNTSIIQDETKENNKQITQLNNDCEFSGLLNIPLKADDWFFVIDDMTRSFYSEHGKRPNEVQAWGQLWTRQPTGYTVSTGKDKGEDCLNMPSVKPLSRSAFKERWKRYIDKPQ